MSHKPVRNVTQAGPKCHTRAKMSHSHVIIMYRAWSAMCDLGCNKGFSPKTDTILENLLCSGKCFYSQ